MAGLAYAMSCKHYYIGIIASIFVYANMVSDFMDGRHARTTGQCRNGGEILDHFFDPLSFSILAVGICYSIDRLDLAVIAIIGIYCNAVLSFQEAMITGTLILKKFGPAELRLLLILYGISLSLCQIFSGLYLAQKVTFYFILFALAVSYIQLVIEIIKTINRVNKIDVPADSSSWLLKKIDD